MFCSVVIIKIVEEWLEEMVIAELSLYVSMTQ